MEEAIQLYQRIVFEFAEDRSLAANALLQLGSVYEKLGMPDAHVAYRRVIEDFADQPQQSRVARARLAAVTRRPGGSSSIDPTYTFALDDITGGRLGYPAPYDFSPDGRQVVFRDHVPSERPPGLYVADRGGSVIRPLITLDAVGGPIEGLWSPRWSPDGRRIAFTARYPERDQTMMGLYLIDLDGGAVERVGDSFGGDLCWTPDGSAVTFVGDTDRRLYTRSVTGPLREVTLGEPLPQATLLGGYSPDGMWLALDIQTERLGREMRDIWIMAADGSERFHVTDSPGLDANPTWGRDGNLYFLSDRRGSVNIWRLGIDAITGRRQPRARMRLEPRPNRPGTSRLDAPLPGNPEQVTFFTDARVAYPRVVGGNGVIAFVLQRVTNTVHVAEATRPYELRPLIRGSNPQPSPDGRRVFFEGEGSSREGIFVVSKDGGTPVRLIRGSLPRLSGIPQFHVSPDGAGVAYVDEANGDRAILVVPAAGGTPRRLASGAVDESSLPRWSPEGDRIAFAGGRGLYVASRDGGQPTKIGDLSRWDGSSVRWSPDGQYLAALGWEGPGGQNQAQNHVFVVGVSGGELRRLTPAAEWQFKVGLEWHPNGEEITYLHNADALRTAYLDGRPTTLFLDAPETWDYVGTWAPDGSAYYFMASEDGRLGWQLYRRESATGAISEVIAGDDLSLPNWSRDGTTMALSVRQTVNQLWVMEQFR
jgi:Tol biopolymer transport system component